MTGPVKQPIWSEDILKKRQQRATVLAWLLAGFVVLIIFVTIARIGANIAQRPPIGFAPVTMEKK